jgi:hypothetical protein
MSAGLYSLHQVVQGEEDGRTGVQEFRSSGVQEFRSAGVQKYRSQKSEAE